MSEPRCDFSDLPVSACGHCKGIKDEPAPVPGYGPLFFAYFYGRCSGCDVLIVPDDTIRADGQGGYLHEDCADEH
jgi:hypothetical protein